jgi:hypothetical protein
LACSGVIPHRWKVDQACLGQLCATAPPGDSRRTRPPRWTRKAEERFSWSLFIGRSWNGGARGVAIARGGANNRSWCSKDGLEEPYAEDESGRGTSGKAVVRR